MNTILERAVAILTKLPEAEQEAIGLRLLEDLETECAWNERFARTQDGLAELAWQASDRIARGEVFGYDPSNRSAA